MKRIITTTLLALLVITGSCIAADLKYPCQNLILKGDYSKAHNELAALLKKNPQDLSVLYAASRLYSAPDNPNKNLDLAYRYAWTGLELVEAKKDKETQKMISKGFTKYLFQLAIDECVEQATIAAKDIDTPEAYTAVLNKYPKVGDWNRKKLIGLREKAALRLAQEKGTIDAYTKFIADYPKSALVTQAEWNIHELAYKKLRRLNSRKASTDYIKQYPNSHRVPDVLNRLFPAPYDEDELSEDNRGWYQKRADTTAYELLAALRMQRTLTRFAQRKKNLFAAQNGYKTFVAAYKDSCWLVLHDLYMASGNVDNFQRFYNDYPNSHFPEITRHDSIVIREGKDTRSSAFIRAAAPYPIAYEMMVANIAEFINKGKWDAALEYCAGFSEQFGDDKHYNQLIDMLKAPVEKTLTKQKLSDKVNTKEGEEYSPIISFDGQTLYFTGRYRKDNLVGGTEDIYFSTKDKKGRWGKAIMVATLSSAGQHEMPLSVSTDGSKIIIYKSFGKVGKMCSANKSAYVWTNPEPLSDTINFSSWNVDAMLTSDGKAMLFTAEGGITHEAYISPNIFVSLLDSAGNWGKPIDLGPTINTARMDRSPFLHPDMKTLYFSSAGHGGLGGRDVFKSTRLNPNSWTEWSEPVNLGKMINSPGNDWGYKVSTDGTTAYFSDTHDLYSIDMPEDMRPEPVVAISGFVTDQSGKAAKVVVQWTNEDQGTDVGKIQVTAEDGAYFYVLTPGYVYSYTIRDERYEPLKQTIDLRGINQMDTREVNIRLKAIKKGGAKQAVED